MNRNIVLAAWALVLGCGAASDPPSTLPVREDGVDLPLRGATPEEVDAFFDGDGLFGLPFRTADGIGPLYIRTNCESCHEEGMRGPGTVEKMVIVAADGRTPAADQSALALGHTVRPRVDGGASQALLPPTSGWGSGDSLLVSVRLPPAVVGRGYMEAVTDAEIERVEAEQAARGGAISGRINRVRYHSEANPDRRFHQRQPGDMNLIGRFGLKARQPGLDDFAADAFQGDMGVTSPLRPNEVPNPDGLTDDGRPGVDVDAEQVNMVARYMRLIEIPTREAPDSRAVSLFVSTQCASCHVPTLHTRADYPIALLADIDAPIYCDMLLHDMGEGFADGLLDESAGSSEWRTAPLIGMRFSRSYLHDGRAHSVKEAILAHDAEGSEAKASAQAFRALSEVDQAALIQFVESL